MKFRGRPYRSIAPPSITNKFSYLDVKLSSASTLDKSRVAEANASGALALDSTQMQEDTQQKPAVKVIQQYPQLSNSELDHLLARMPPLIDDTPKADFFKREDTLKPPKLGEEEQTPFPPTNDNFVPMEVADVALANVDQEGGDSSGASGSSKSVTKAPALPLEVFHHRPTGVCESVSSFEITFSQPMVAVSDRSEVDDPKNNPIVVEPSSLLEYGKFSWRGAKTLLFEVHGANSNKPGGDIAELPASTQYTIRVPAGTKSAIGGELNQEYSFSFSTRTLFYTTAYPLNTTVNLNPRFFLAFNQKVAKDQVIQNMELRAANNSQPIALRLADETEPLPDTYHGKIFSTYRKNYRSIPETKRMEFVAAEQLAPNTKYQLVIKKSTPSLEGPLTTPNEILIPFQTYSPLKCTNRSESNYYGNTVFLNFNNPLVGYSKATKAAAADFAKFIRIEPSPANLRITPPKTNSSNAIISGRFTKGEQYKFTVLNDFQDIYGQTLPSQHQFSIRFATINIHRSNYLNSPGGSFIVMDPVTLRKAGSEADSKPVEPTFDFHVNGYSRVRILAYRVKPEDYAEFTKLQTYNVSSEADVTRLLGSQFGELVFDESRNINYDEPTDEELAEEEESSWFESDQYNYYRSKPRKMRIPLANLLNPNGFGHLLFIVEGTPFKPRSDRRLFAWVQCTSLAVDAIVDRKTLYCYINKLDDGSPVQNATCALHKSSSQGVALATGTTNATGMAELSIESQTTKGGLLIARVGDDTALLVNINTLTSSPNQRRAYITTDRGLYKPKEKVSVKGWVRDIKPDEREQYLSLHFVQGTFSYSVNDSRSREFAKGTVTLNRFGAFDFQFEIPDNVNLGHAHINVTIENAHAGAAFQIQEFRVPEFKNSCELEAFTGPFVSNAYAVVTANASYYSGGPLNNADCNWSVAYSEGPYSPPNWSQFTFGNHSFSFSKSQQTPMVFSSKTDDDGKHCLKISFEGEEINPNAVNFVVESAIQDINRQTLNANTNFTMYPSRYFIGLRRKTKETGLAGANIITPESNVSLEFVVTDVDGKVIPNVPILFSAYNMGKESKHVTKNWSNFSASRLVEDSRTYGSIYTSALLLSGEQPVSHKLQLPEVGVWYLRATVAEDKSASATTEEGDKGKRFNSSSMTLNVYSTKKKSEEEEIYEDEDEDEEEMPVDTAQQEPTKQEFTALSSEAAQSLLSQITTVITDEQKAALAERFDLRYLLDVSHRLDIEALKSMLDPVNGLYSAYPYADMGYHDPASEYYQLSNVTITTDKQQYNAGDIAKVTIEPPKWRKTLTTDTESTEALQKPIEGFLVLSCYSVLSVQRFTMQPSASDATSHEPVTVSVPIHQKMIPNLVVTVYLFGCVGRVDDNMQSFDIVPKQTEGTESTASSSTAELATNIESMSISEPSASNPAARSQVPKLDPRAKKIVEKLFPNLDISAPMKAHGVSFIEISDEPRQLNVAVTPEAPAVAPGSNLVIDIDVSKKRVDPSDPSSTAEFSEPSEVALIVVDEAVLSLTNHTLSNPLTTFLHRNNSSHSGRSSRDHIHRVDWRKLFKLRVEDMIRKYTKQQQEEEEDDTSDMDEECDDGDDLECTTTATNSLMSRNAVMSARNAPVMMASFAMESASADFGGGMATKSRKRMMMKSSAVAEESCMNGEEGESSAAPIALRSNFSSLAAFMPSVVTDIHGKARVTISLPDNLTRYRIWCLAANGPTMFGLGESSVTVQLPLVIRPSPPRFLNFGDTTVEVPFVLQNQTYKQLTVNVAARSNTNISMVNASAVVPALGFKVVLPPNGRSEVRFPVSSVRPGVAKIQAGIEVCATSSEPSDFADAAQVTFPVFTPVTSEAFATYGTIDTPAAITESEHKSTTVANADGSTRTERQITGPTAAIVQPIRAPAQDVHPEVGGVSVSVSSTALYSLLDSFLYIYGYKYDSCEQIASRVLSCCALGDVMTQFQPTEAEKKANLTQDSIPKKSEIDEAMNKSILKLSQNQRADGGWGFWTQLSEDFPYVSTHVAHSLAVAKDKGYEVDDQVLTKAKRYLQNIHFHLTGTLWSRKSKNSLKAFALYVRHRLGEDVVNDAFALLDIVRRKPEDPNAATRDPNKGHVTIDTEEGISVEALAWLFVAVSSNEIRSRNASGNQMNVDDRVQQAKRELIYALKESIFVEADAAHIIDKSSFSGMYLMLSSPSRGDALWVNALIEVDPQNPLIEPLVKGLMKSRRRGRWYNIQENVSALLALDRYFNTYEKITPDFVAHTWLDTLYGGQQQFSGRSGVTKTIQIPMSVIIGDTAATSSAPAAVAERPTKKLVLVKAGVGRMYYRIAMNCFPRAFKPNPSDYGIAVTRTYEAITESGSSADQQTSDAVNNADDVRQDGGVWYIKAGKQVRVTLTISSTKPRCHVALVDYLPAGCEAVNFGLIGSDSVFKNKLLGNEDNQDTIGPYYRWRRYPSHWYDHKNLRDERVEVFASYLYPGTQTFSYIVRATTPGDFIVPSAKAEEMYNPELYGTSQGDHVIVHA